MIHINNQINAASNLITMIEKTESRDDVFGDLDFRAICDSAKESLMDYIRKVVGNPDEDRHSILDNVQAQGPSAQDKH